MTEDVESGLLVKRDPLLQDISVPGTLATEDRAAGTEWGGLSVTLVFCQAQP
ncbi:MAG: hypothetical protein ACXV3F_05390 [Frankiaceae bacterium]